MLQRETETHFSQLAKKPVEGGLLCSGAWATVLVQRRFGDSGFAPMANPVNDAKGPWQWSIDSRVMSVLPATLLQMNSEANNLI